MVAVHGCRGNLDLDVRSATSDHQGRVSTANAVEPDASDQVFGTIQVIAADRLSLRSGLGLSGEASQ